MGRRSVFVLAGTLTALVLGAVVVASMARSRPTAWHVPTPGSTDGQLTIPWARYLVSTSFARPSDEPFRTMARHAVRGTIADDATRVYVADMLFLWPVVTVPTGEKLLPADFRLRVEAYNALIDATADDEARIAIVTFAGKSVGYGWAFDDDFHEQVVKAGVPATRDKLTRWTRRNWVESGEMPAEAMP